MTDRCWGCGEFIRADQGVVHRAHYTGKEVNHA